MPHPTFDAVDSVRRRELSVSEYIEGVLSRDRTVLARAITLVESNHPRHERMAQEVLRGLLPHAGGAHRVGITGVPGAGKSTFIEALGTNLTEAGHRVAVLAIDPSSSLTGGSILGDKTRMGKLSTDPNAFIRPTPSSCTLGGVARKTRETMLVCEAGGFDVILVETVGVGQSETVVADMVDFFLVLMIAGAGDELQGIKRGVLEMADLVTINKCDGDNETRARLAQREYATALHFMRPKSPSWTVPVVTCSALNNIGLQEIWQRIDEHRQALTASGELPERRRKQLLSWMWSMIEEQLLAAFKEHPSVVARLGAAEQAVHSGTLTATEAALSLLDAFGIKS